MISAKYDAAITTEALVPRDCFPAPVYVWKSLAYGAILSSITTTWMWLTNQVHYAMNHKIRQASEMYIEI